MEKITGKNNDLIKSVKKLLLSSKQRRLQGCFVLEGARLVFDALNSFYTIKYFLITEGAYQKYRNAADKMVNIAQMTYLISDDLADKLGDTKSSQGIFAVCEIKQGEVNITPDDKVIALDNIQDPANLGAILRSAEALGINALIIGGGCDMYNPKALRASMGSALRIKAKCCDNLADELSVLKDNGFSVYAAVPDSDAISITDISFNGGCVCVIGNEANGVSDEVKALCNDCITIRMLGNAESLNASVAAAITMWEMLR